MTTAATMIPLRREGGCATSVLSSRGACTVVVDVSATSTSLQDISCNPALFPARVPGSAWPRYRDKGWIRIDRLPALPTAQPGSPQGCRSRHLHSVAAPHSTPHSPVPRSIAQLPPASAPPRYPATHRG